MHSRHQMGMVFARTDILRLRLQRLGAYGLENYVEHTLVPVARWSLVNMLPKRDGSEALHNREIYIIGQSCRFPMSSRWSAMQSTPDRSIILGAESTTSIDPRCGGRLDRNPIKRQLLFNFLNIKRPYGSLLQSGKNLSESTKTTARSFFM